MDAIELHVKFNGKEYRDSIPMNRVRDIYGNALRNVRANGR